MPATTTCCNLPEEEDIAKAHRGGDGGHRGVQARTAKACCRKDEYYRAHPHRQETQRFPRHLLRQFANIPDDADGDVFGQIYEYFLGNFALAEGQGGGEFFTPRSVVRLMVEIIEPHGGTVFDPACGSGGMFVQSADFIAAAPQGAGGTGHGHQRVRLRAGEDARDRQAGQDEPGRQRPARRDPAGQHLLRRPVRQPSANSTTCWPIRPFNVDDVTLASGGEGPALQHLRHAAQQDQGQEDRAGQGDRAQRQLPVDQPVRHLAQRPAAAPRW